MPRVPKNKKSAIFVILRESSRNPEPLVRGSREYEIAIGILIFNEPKIEETVIVNSLISNFFFLGTPKVVSA